MLAQTHGMAVIQRIDVEAARDRIRGRVRETPLLRVELPGLAAPVTLKLEQLQHTGSFKPRGAFHRILTAAEQGLLDPAVGVVVASGGNAGLANAFAARALGVPAVVFVPTTAPAVKVAKLKTLGAEVREVGTEYAVAYEAAVAHAQATGAVSCHAYDQPEVVAGAGTLALELPEADTVVVAVGGGGLMAGVAAALEGVSSVVGVEPTSAPTLRAALEHGSPVDVAVSGIAADSLGARRVGDIAFDVATRCGVRSELVTDDAIVEARRLLWRELRLVVEHGAATALAGLTSGAYVPGVDERVVVVLCGANTDPSDL